MMTMSEKIAAPRGTQDILPVNWRLRSRVLDGARRHFERAGFGRITTPTFEHTELFHRGVGEATDIVGKETYTFTDRGNRSLTLRPEGTAGVSRAFVSAGMHREPLPVKLWYAMPMFRYEKPQAGRLREHEQLGCEVLGSDLALVDAEVLSIQAGIYKELGLPDLKLHINSIGSTQARLRYRSGLVEYLTPFAQELDPDSRERLLTNPLRILDSKDSRTQQIVQSAPRLVEFLTSDDRSHFDEVCGLLNAIDIDFAVNPFLVRGLDYYTRTVWEFSSSALGAQSTIGAGGRYDGLVKQLGGVETPAVGFGTGVERIVLCLEAMQAQAPSSLTDVFIGISPDATPEAGQHAFALANALRERGQIVELDLGGRSVKGQIKLASRMQASIRVLVDNQGMRMFARRDFDGVELSHDVGRSLEMISANLTNLNVQ